MTLIFDNLRNRARRSPNELISWGAALALAIYPFVLTNGSAFGQSPSSSLLLRLLIGGVYNLLFFCLILVAIGCLRPGLIRRCASVILWSYLALFTFLSMFHFELYGQLIGVASIYAVIDTNSDESIEYLESAARLSVILLPILTVIPFLFARKLSFGISFSSRMRLPLLFVSVMFGGVVVYVGFQKTFLYMNNPILFGIQAVNEAFTQKELINQAYAQMDINASLMHAQSNGEPATHILVIGEATTRRHMSLYGYNRATSPKLAELRSQIYLDEDACSSHGTTIPSLKEMLSFATREDPTPLFKAPNLLQVMKAAGFKTYWISNQQKVGFSDSWAGIFAASADVQIFVNKRGWTEGVSLDEMLFEPLRDALSDGATNRFIIVHLVGGHQAYALRYPPSYSIFDTPEGVDQRVLAKSSSFFDRYLLSNSALAQYNAYDNAMLYNDFVVSELIKMLMPIKRATLTYSPDHGEALAETSNMIGHADGPAPRQVYEIPLLFYFSPDIQSELATKREAFQRNLKKPYQSDHLIHTLLDLYDVKYPLLRPAESLLNGAFALGPRFCDTLH